MDDCSNEVGENFSPASQTRSRYSRPNSELDALNLLNKNSLELILTIRGDMARMATALHCKTHTRPFQQILLSKMAAKGKAGE
jgi:hypothetical protein